MLRQVLIGVGMICAAAIAHADVGCSAALMTRWDGIERIAQSLRADKPGQARVFALDGSEYSGAQSYWMKGQLRKTARLCARSSGDAEAQAARVIEELEALVHEHGHGQTSSR
jgi:hypothetical protein